MPFEVRTDGPIVEIRFFGGRASGGLGRGPIETYRVAPAANPVRHHESGAARGHALIPA